LSSELPIQCAPPDEETARCLERICTDFCWLVDHGFADRTAHLFTEDVLYCAQGRESHGLAEVMRRMSERAMRRDYVSRHVSTGFRFHRLEPDEVHGHSLMVVYRDHATPALVADVHDVFRREESGVWKLAKRRIISVLAPKARAGWGRN
jgi:hypothetical protein